jgi:hypothetical protein
MIQQKLDLFQFRRLRHSAGPMTNEVPECRLPPARFKSERITSNIRREGKQHGHPTSDGPGPLADSLAHFGSDQLREVAFYIVTRFSNHGGSALAFGVAALMRL